MSYNQLEQLKQFIVDVIDQRLSQLGISQGYLQAGKINSVSGNRASVFVNGSTTATPNIPIMNGLTLAAGDEVWIIKVNFSQIDKMVWCKRPI